LYFDDYSSNITDTIVSNIVKRIHVVAVSSKLPIYNDKLTISGYDANEMSNGKYKTQLFNYLYDSHYDNYSNKYELFKYNKQMKLKDRIKQYENTTTSLKLDSTIPVVCRLDGVNFSKFTKSLKKPYDIQFSNLMYEVTLFACKEVGANIAYTQSDEITLIWLQGINSEMYHGGKIYKILSKLSAKVSVKFNTLLPKYLPSKVGSEPTFDCRVFNVPSKMEAFNSLLDRVEDCKKNSVSSLFYYTFGHKKGLNKNTEEKIELLVDVGDWNDYPDKYKFGRFIKKFVVDYEFGKKELEGLPPNHDAIKNPGATFTRNVYTEININQQLHNCNNKEEFIFESVNPKF